MSRLDIDRDEKSLGIDGGISESILDAISKCFKSLKKPTKQKETNSEQLSFTTTSHSQRRVQLFYLVRNDLLKTEGMKRVAINPES